MTSSTTGNTFTVIIPREQQDDAQPQEELGLEERRLLMSVTGPQPRLDYPTKTFRNALGKDIEVYQIPQDERADVLEQMYPFPCTPDMNATLFDIHQRQMFTVKDYMITREGEGNFLVSPYYLQSGGTVLDWLELPEDGSLDSLLGDEDEER